MVHAGIESDGRSFSRIPLAHFDCNFVTVNAAVAQLILFHEIFVTSRTLNAIAAIMRAEFL